MNRGPRAGFASSPMSKPEAELNHQLRAVGIEFVREHQFLETRKFRFDFALLRFRIGIEVEGGTWVSGRHTRGAGYAKDCEKSNLAQLDGWMVLRFVPDQIKSGMALQMIQWSIVERGKQLRDA